MPALKESHQLDATLAAIVAHPVRARCLAILSERTASPAELSRELACSVGKAGYHVRKLAELGLVEEVGSRPVRGALEHFFRSIQRPLISNEESADRTPEEREAFIREACQLILTDAAASLDAGTFAKRFDYNACRTPMLIDEAGWAELRDIYDETLERTLEVQARAQERLLQDPDSETFPVTAATMVFERP